MTQDEIIEAASMAGLHFTKQIEAFAKLVEERTAAKERLDCFDAAYQAYATSEVLKAIRARGEA
jgi:hypothetical protein